MQSRTQRRTRGFTMMELAVVLAASGLLAVQLGPAIQQAREVARRSQCKNNLKQLGLALFNYHETHRVLPPGWVEDHAHAVSSPGYGWQTMILPFTDEAALYNQMFVSRSKMPAEATAETQSTIATYRCPSDPTEKTNAMRSNFGTSNYSGNHGNVGSPRWAPGPLAQFWPGAVDTPRAANGIFWWNSNARIRDIVDGTSNTFMAGERSLTSGAGIWAGVTTNHNETDAVSDCSPGHEINADFAAFSSLHEGGAHFLICDGSVRFILESVESKAGEGASMGLYQKLAAKNDGQPLGEF